MTTHEIIQRLEGVHGHAPQWTAKCPSHDDHTASLSIGIGADGRTLLTCHSGCETAAIMDTLGLSMRDLMPEQESRSKAVTSRSKRTIVATYPYLDANGTVIAEKVRYSNKTFGWRRVDETGKTVWNRNGITMTPYNLPEILKADVEQVFLVEGEKDCATMHRMDLCATTSPDGAGSGKSKWHEHYNGWFRGKHVIIVPDNDNVGQTFAIQVADALHGIAESVKLLDLRQAWAELPNKGDVSDVAQKFGDKATREMLDKLVLKTPLYMPSRNERAALSTFTAEALQTEQLLPVRFFVKDLLPQGLALLASPPKFGKSWWVLDMGLSIAAGLPFMGHETVKGDCLYLALEDSKNRLQSRMNAILRSNPAPAGLHYAITCPDMATGLLDALEEHISAHPQTVLVIIDTFQKVRAQKDGKDTAYSADYKDMGVLKEFADKHGICVLLVHHLRKALDEGDPFARISGTNGILGAVDTAMVMCRTKRDDINTTLSVTGRDAESSETILTFDKVGCRWAVIGDASEIAAKQARQEYDTSPIVLTIRKLMEQKSDGWRGRIADLMDCGRAILGVNLAATTHELSRAVKALISPLLEHDGIIVSRSGNGTGGGTYRIARRNLHLATNVQDEQPTFDDALI